MIEFKHSVPEEEIRDIILCWGYRDYINTTIPDLRAFFEHKLKRPNFSRDVVEVWIKQAHAWVKDTPPANRRRMQLIYDNQRPKDNALVIKEISQYQHVPDDIS